MDLLKIIIGCIVILVYLAVQYPILIAAIVATPICIAKAIDNRVSIAKAINSDIQKNSSAKISIAVPMRLPISVEFDQLINDKSAMNYMALLIEQFPQSGLFQIKTAEDRICWEVWKEIVQKSGKGKGKYEIYLEKYSEDFSTINSKRLTFKLELLAQKMGMTTYANVSYKTKKVIFRLSPQPEIKYYEVPKSYQDSIQES